ncbi:MAG: hypothetical protein ACD_34C00324G0001 [uncultured bacterium]|nr:MAG: hypothetical protein ACD_34C00324G0001 [uncultured bacterium]
MTGISFGICDNDFVGVVFKCVAQCKNLGTGTSASCRSIGFMRDKHSFSSDCISLKTKAFFSRSDQGFHQAGHMRHIQAGAVESTVREL